MRDVTIYLRASMFVSALLLGGIAGGQNVDKKEAGRGKELRVAVAQIPITRDIDANLETIGRAIDRAIAEKAEILRLCPQRSPQSRLFAKVGKSQRISLG